MKKPSAENDPAKMDFINVVELSRSFNDLGPGDDTFKPGSVKRDMWLINCQLAIAQQLTVMNGHLASLSAAVRIKWEAEKEPDEWPPKKPKLPAPGMLQKQDETEA